LAFARSAKLQLIVKTKSARHLAGAFIYCATELC
jgi:hypothetical protein